MQVRFVNLCEKWISYLTVHFSEKAQRYVIKNESFNIIMSREKESIARKVKKAKDVCGKPLRRDKKPRVSKGGMSLILFSSLLCKKIGSFPRTMMVFFLEERPFSLPHFPTNFLLFSLMFSPGSCCCSPCGFFFF